MRDSRPAGVAALGIAFAATLGWLSIQASAPPRSVGVEAPATEFSAARALETVRAIAESPRPMGAVAHTRARVHLEEALRRMGLETEVQESTVLLPRGRRLLGARVRNLIARLPGGGRQGAVLLMAHYDSVPGSPGAGDDAVGVAAILETVRALVAGPALARDVVVLLTDGEEAGLLGARAFADEPENLADLALVLNFEARGSGGPVLMFETAAGSHPLVEVVARVAPRPIASSLSYEVYRRMPNDTDFSVLRRAGLVGLNFAMIGGFASYHTRLDNLERLDEASLQHHGSYALSLTRHLAGLEKLPPAGADGVYFNGFGGSLFLSYSSNTARTLATLLLVLAALVLTERSRRHHGRVAGVGWGAALFLAAAVAGLAAAIATWRGLLVLAPDLLLAPHGVPWIAAWLAVAGALLTLALVAALVRLLSGLAEDADLWAGVLVLWTLAAVASSFFLPGASYVFQWPAVVGWVGLFLAERLSGSRRWRVVVATAFALPAVALLAPVFRLLLEALTVRQAGPALVFLALVSTLFTVPLAELTSWGRNWVEAGLAVAALAVLVAAVLAAGPSPAAPVTDHLFYAFDADRGAGHWMSSDDVPDDWTAAYVGADAAPASAEELLPFLRSPVLSAAAPVFLGEPPRVEVEAGGELSATVVLEVSSPRGAPVLWLRIEGEKPFTLVRVDGREAPEGTGDSNGVQLTFFGAGPEGIEVELKAGDGGLALSVADQSYGLPTFSGEVPRRPADRIPPASWISDTSFVVRRFEWSPPPMDDEEAAEAPEVADG